MKKAILTALCIAILLTSVVVSYTAATPSASATSLGVAPVAAIEKVWQRTDLPIQNGKISRTWMWGPPGAFGNNGFDVREEPYAQSPGGTRTVFYFDKSRMEITQPLADSNSKWYVTNGLLTKELVTGQMQVGDAQFETRAPAEIPVAGDSDDTNGPTYATFGNLLAQVGGRGGAVTDTVGRAGNVGQNPSLGGYASYAHFVSETGHNIPNVFWDFLNSSGMVYENGSYRTGKLFDPTFFATGYPISEPYWSQVKVGGQSKWVLIQAFERRVLTYTPSNPEGWKVEMGNIGRHYHDWRYSQPSTPPAPADPFADVPACVDASVTPKGGPVGTTFSMNIWGFTPNEQIGYWVNAPDGSIVGTIQTVSIGPTGGVEGLTFPTDSSYPLGIWSVVFQGTQSGHQSIAYFKLTGEGAAPAPAPAPTQSVPDSISGSVSPKEGRAGTVFDVSIWGFQPNEQVGYWFNTPDGAVYGTVQTVSIGPTGRVDHLQMTSDGMPPGIWSLVFHGVNSGHESVIYFKITE
ncbi:MAG: hypothetical protein M1319_03565 [Chloroflexi bacterium]|nr:hypothetical protein [Chloroflexota bacterium]